MLEKDGEDQFDRSCEKWRSGTCSQGGEEYHIYSKKKEGNWIGRSLCRNCSLEQVIEGKVGGKDGSYGKTRKKT